MENSNLEIQILKILEELKESKENNVSLFQKKLAEIKGFSEIDIGKCLNKLIKKQFVNGKGAYIPDIVKEITIQGTHDILCTGERYLQENC